MLRQRKPLNNWSYFQKLPFRLLADMLSWCDSKSDDLIAFYLAERHLPVVKSVNVFYKKQCEEHFPGRYDYAKEKIERNWILHFHDMKKPEFYPRFTTSERELLFAVKHQYPSEIQKLIFMNQYFVEKSCVYDWFKKNESGISFYQCAALSKNQELMDRCYEKITLCGSVWLRDRLRDAGSWGEGYPDESFLFCQAALNQVDLIAKAEEDLPDGKYTEYKWFAPMKEAIRLGHIDSVKAIRKHLSKKKLSNHYLRIAAEYGHLDVVTYLRKEVSSQCQFTMLELAIENEKMDVLALYLKELAVDINDEIGIDELLEPAVSNLRPAALTHLLNLKYKTNKKNALLFHALTTKNASNRLFYSENENKFLIEQRRLAVVKRLLAERDVNINTQDKSGNTPLHHAVLAGQIEVVKLLLAMPGIDVNRQSEAGDSALHCAVNTRSLAITKLLLSDERVKINLQNNKQQTPLDRIFTKTELEEVLNVGPIWDGGYNREEKIYDDRDFPIYPTVEIKPVDRPCDQLDDTEQNILTLLLKRPDLDVTIEKMNEEAKRHSQNMRYARRKINRCLTINTPASIYVACDMFIKSLDDQNHRKSDDENHATLFQNNHLYKIPNRNEKNPRYIYVKNDKTDYFALLAKKILFYLLANEGNNEFNVTCLMRHLNRLGSSSLKKLKTAIATLIIGQTDICIKRKWLRLAVEYKNRNTALGRLFRISSHWFWRASIDRDEFGKLHQEWMGLGLHLPAVRAPAALMVEEDDKGKSEKRAYTR